MMKIIISLILIYLTIINIYLYNKEKNESFLGLRNWFQYFFSLIFFLSFLGFFVIFVRVLNLFRLHSVLDLKLIILNNNLFYVIIIIIFLISLRKLLFFFAKISFFKLHYFYLAPENNRYCKQYYNFYIKIIYRLCNKVYLYFYWSNFLMFFMLLFIFFIDCFQNSFVLNYSLIFLKYYSLFAITNGLIKFVSTKQKLMLDYYLFNLYYMDGISIDEGFFAETLSKNANAILHYRDNIILV